MSSCTIALALAAANHVSLVSDVFVEKADKASTVLQAPQALSRGDRVVFVLSYRNRGSAPASNFFVTNPVPGSVAFAGAEDDGALVSVDGGRSWGRLADLKVATAEGTWRPALPADVTHVRWAVQRPIGAGETGKLSYRAIVR